MPIPAFYLNFNAESCTPYHNDDVANDRAELISGDGHRGETVWKLNGHNATVTESRETFDGIGVTRLTTTLRNDGAESLLVDCLASAFVTGIGAEGRRWYEDRFIIHYCHSVWQGEGQWRKATAEELGLYPTYNHGHQTAFRLYSQGSWTTSRHYPLIFIEDTETGETHYFEILTGSNWYIEVSAKGYRENSALCVLLTAAFEKNGGWYKELKPGETYTAPPALYGCVKGGFEEAVAEITAYKRATYHTDFPTGHVPVCFNDYMNCLWAQPSLDRLMPLIEAAHEAGCEVFCIDAGWFGKRGEWYKHNGDWQPCDELFGEGGLQGILAEIKKRGMLPGVWLEIETADAASDFAQAHPEALLTRHGHPIGKGQCFVDFRQPVVRDHLMQVFDHLYGMGVRFIKNDYNHSTGIGIDPLNGEDASMAEALRGHTEAFYRFIDEVISTHPGLMIENCGSGAMRCDHSTLSHFHIQSTSDQEYYDRYPSILQGMLAVMPPERAGVWAYPYPVDFHQMGEQGDVFPLTGESVKNTVASCADGWQTAYNMVSGMMGAMYLSGRICYADELNKKLISDAISIYKENRATLAGAIPVYPTGLSRMSDGGHTSLGLLNEKEGKLLLAVWQTRTEETQATIDLTPYITDNAAIIRTYPDLAGFGCSLNDGCLTAAFPVGNRAAYIEITL